MAQVNDGTSADAIAAGCCNGLGELLSTRFFKALCDPSRLTILTQLATEARPTTVSEAAGCCPKDLSVVSRHLKTLQEAGILTAERSGREVRYSVRFAEVAKTLRAIADAIEACCPPGSTSCCAAVCAPTAEPATPPTGPSTSARASNPNPRRERRTRRAPKEKRS